MPSKKSPASIPGQKPLIDQRIGQPLDEVKPSVKPECFALSPKGRDPYFGCTRSWYYAAEKQGLIRLIRIRGRGKLRGIVRVPYDEMAKLFREGRQ